MALPVKGRFLIVKRIRVSGTLRGIGIAFFSIPKMIRCKMKEGSNLPNPYIKI